MLLILCLLSADISGGLATRFWGHGRWDSKAEVTRTCSFWNSMNLWLKYCLWGLDAHKNVALGSSANSELDYGISKLHPKGVAWKLFSMSKFRYSSCLYAGGRLKHMLPCLLCALVSVGKKPGYRSELHYALVWNKIPSKGAQNLGVDPKAALVLT